MRSRLALLIVFLICIVSLCISGGQIPGKAAGASEAEPPDKITIKVPLGGNVFSKIYTHKDHVDEYGAECIVCHHVYDEDKNVREDGMPRQKCVECHGPESLGIEEDVVPGLLLKELMVHESCKDCHKK